METIWYKGKDGGLWMQEELKLEYLNRNFNPFELCNFLSWLEALGFERLN